MTLIKTQTTEDGRRVFYIDLPKAISEAEIKRIMAEAAEKMIKDAKDRKH